MTDLAADLATLREDLDRSPFTCDYGALDRVEAELARLTARRSRYAEARYENCMGALSAAEAEAARLREELGSDDDANSWISLKRRAEAAEARLSEAQEKYRKAVVHWRDHEQRNRALRDRCARLQQALEEVREIVNGWDEPLVSYERRNSRIQVLVSEALAGPDTPADSQEDKT